MNDPYHPRGERRVGDNRPTIKGPRKKKVTRPQGVKAGDWRRNLEQAHRAAIEADRNRLEAHRRRGNAIVAAQKAGITIEDIAAAIHVKPGAIQTMAAKATAH